MCIGFKDKKDKKEKVYKKFCGNLYLDKDGTEDDPDPYWRHICNKDKFVADILTKSPDKLGEGSVWENGPDWLIVERSHHWPVTEVVLDSTDPVVALHLKREEKH